MTIPSKNAHYMREYRKEKDSMKRYISLMLIYVLLLSMLSANAASYLDPKPEWWGMSRSAVLKEMSYLPFKELDVNDRKVLVLRGLVAGIHKTDNYFYFGEKPSGKSYYGLSDYLWIISIPSKKFTNSKLKSIYDEMVELVSETHGQPYQSSSKASQWDCDDYSITVMIDSFKDFNGSDDKTVAIIYSAKTEEDPIPTATPKVSTSSGKAIDMQVSVDAKCSDYNHIGEIWQQVYYLNGKRLTDGKSVSLKAGDVITVSAKISEEDSNPDIGENSKTYTVTKDDLNKGFKITFNVQVEENGGRYKGNKAAWRVTFSFSRK